MSPAQMFAMENGKIWRETTKIVQIFSKMNTYLFHIYAY